MFLSKLSKSPSHCDGLETHLESFKQRKHVSIVLVEVGVRVGVGVEIGVCKAELATEDLEIDGLVLALMTG